MKVFDIPGIWWLMGKTLAAAVAGSFLFGAAVSSMAMMEFGISWQGVTIGGSAMAISIPVLLVLGLAWIMVRARVIQRQIKPQQQDTR
ncbi:hypothetical protein [Belnapia rosea]|nr:hypothetical protein [Belnapia rosea]